jgi:hypothetical protein
VTLIKTSSTQQRFSRRALLKGLGVSGAFLPLLHAEPAKAATANGFPRRLVTITWTNGIAQTMLYPAADTDPTASPILAPFAALKSKVLLVAGVDYSVMSAHKYDGHFSYPVAFTGTYVNTGNQNCTSGGPSLDQVVSDAFAKDVTLKIPLLNITLNGTSTSYRAAAQRNTGENNAARLFTSLFGSAKLPAAQVGSALEAQKSVLEFVGGELTSFTAKMGAEDKAKIDAHLDSVRQLEKRLSAAPTGGAACAAPAAPVGTAYDANVKAMMDMAGMALRCDLTRVVSMVLGADGGSSPGSFPFLQVSGDYHGLAHQGAAGYASKSKIDTWYFQQVANLATSLESSAEGLGTLLDNSVIVTANDMCEGALHSVMGHGMLVVGSGGGYFKTGRVKRLGAFATRTGTYWKGDAGVAHNKLLASIGNAMGVAMTGFGTLPGTLDELTTA